MIFYLIRHAKSISNAANEWTGQIDAALSLEGIKKQKELAVKFAYPKGDLYFSSPLSRSIDTLKIIYGHAPDVILPELSECSLGILEGKRYDNLDTDVEYLSWMNEPDVPVQGGESFNEFKKRSEESFEIMLRLATEKKYKSVVAVTHGNVMRAMLHRFADSSRKHNEWLIPNGGVYMLNVEEGADKANFYEKMPSFLFEEFERSLR